MTPDQAIAQNAPAAVGPLKAAALLESLGPERAAELLKHLSPEEIETLAAGFVQISRVDEPARRALVEQAHRDLRQRREGPLGFAKQVLSGHLGPDQAQRLLSRDSAASHSPLAVLQSLPDAAAEPLAQLLAQEEPRIAAPVLSTLRGPFAARVLSLLPPALAMSSALRLARSPSPAPATLACIVARLVSLLQEAGAKPAPDAAVQAPARAGPRGLVELLGYCDVGLEKDVLEYLAEHDPEIGEEVRRSRFLFEDIQKLEPRSLQIALREVQTGDLARALRGAPPELRDLCFENMSENARAALKEEMEAIGPTPLREVEGAQQKVLEVVRAMIEGGRIQLLREHDQEELV